MIGISGDVMYEAFNRTSMELKPRYHQQRALANILLIEPVWN